MQHSFAPTGLLISDDIVRARGYLPPEMHPTELWRSARLIMLQQGEHAVEHVQRRMAALRHQGGQATAVAVWAEILAVINYVRMLEPPPGAPWH